jgi:hypothetical protein
MIPPALSVVGGVTMIVLATHTSRALVVDDYARIEELTEQRFARDREAARLGLEATFSVAEEPGRVEVRLYSSVIGQLPEHLVLQLQHASDAAADRRIALERSGDRYSARTDIAPGFYRIELMSDPESWRLGSALVRLPGETTLAPPADGG